MSHIWQRIWQRYVVMIEISVGIGARQALMVKVVL